MRTMTYCYEDPFFRRGIIKLLVHLGGGKWNWCHICLYSSRVICAGSGRSSHMWKAFPVPAYLMDSCRCRSPVSYAFRSKSAYIYSYARRLSPVPSLIILSFWLWLPTVGENPIPLTIKPNGELRTPFPSWVSSLTVLPRNSYFDLPLGLHWNAIRELAANA